MNKIILTGNLTRDPELSTTPSGVSVCRFSIAVKRPFSEETDFFNCTAWRGLGENVSKYMQKGGKLLVIGYIQLRNYEDNNGIKRTAVDIICQDCEFLNNKPLETANAPTKPKRPTLEAFDDDQDCPF